MTISYDAVEVGAEAPERRHVLTRTDLVKYAGASGDFNPMHHDELLATAAGMPSVFGHGMFSMGLLCSALTDWAGPGNVVRVAVRFSKQTWPGETLVSYVSVTGKREHEGRRLVDVECTLSNADGERKVVGTATVLAD
ncbi:MAG: MaoC/PaaZ C-terminal domain-containing protein [Acidimicrobiales bacterium]|jgi:acyl dehydratase